MDKALTDLIGKANSKLDYRPMNKEGREDGNFNYIHQDDVLNLVKEAYEAGKKEDVKAFVGKVSEDLGLQWMR